MAGTALAYQGHRATADLLSEPGGRDLTAHVDLTLLRAAAEAGGLRHLASTNQARFLATAGVDSEVARTRTGPAATLEGAIALAQLMDPRRMGGFAVEVFVAGSSPGANTLADPASPLPGTAAPNRPLV
jgi:SAM-dependent MidA family methyltransferase